MSDSNIHPAKFRLPINPRHDMQEFIKAIAAAAEEWETSAQRLSEESNKMAEAIGKLLEAKGKSDKILQDIELYGKRHNKNKCRGNLSPICQRCNRLSFGKGGMIPEAKLGKCKNFQNKRK